MFQGFDNEMRHHTKGEETASGGDMRAPSLPPFQLPLLRPPLLRHGAAALAALVLLLAGPASADKPDWAGGGKGKGGQGKGAQVEHGNRGGNKGGGGKGGDLNVHVDIHFGSNDRVLVRDYYSSRGCPPGLAKKNNGCLPPGQAKKWAKGRPLPRDVIFYDLPHELLIQLRPPPSGYKYVRVAADILMIAIGTGMVMDAIEDLGRL
jgi:hypothetical protein